MHSIRGLLLLSSIICQNYSETCARSSSILSELRRLLDGTRGSFIYNSYSSSSSCPRCRFGTSSIFDGRADRLRLLLLLLGASGNGKTARWLTTAAVLLTHCQLTGCSLLLLAAFAVGRCLLDLRLALHCWVQILGVTVDVRHPAVGQPFGDQTGLFYHSRGVIVLTLREAIHFDGHGALVARKVDPIGTHVGEERMCEGVKRTRAIMRAVL